MKLLPFSSIIIPPERQRRHFDGTKIAELAASIERNGLIVPLVVHGNGTLAAGERRLRAIQQLFLCGTPLKFAGQTLPLGEIPVVDMAELSPEAAFEIELEENIQREDLTWQERAEAVSRLHEMRQRFKPDHSIVDTAESVHGRTDGYYRDVIRKQLIVARHLSDEDVKKAGTIDEAFKVLKRKEERQNYENLGKRMPAQALIGLHALYIGDFSTFTPEPQDIILADPPYGIDVDKMARGGKSRRDRIQLPHLYDDSPEAWIDLMITFSEWSWQHTKPDAHLWVFCDFDGFPKLKSIFTHDGWRVHRTPIIYHKPWSACSQIPNDIRRCYELVLFAQRGARPLNAILPDIFTCERDERNLGHAAQKPIGAYAEILKRSATPGSLVLDPFCGSGTLFPAAHEAKCVATGIEIDIGFAAIAASRLNALV